MNELIAQGTFVEPHFIEELGCEGLTDEEIALALGTHIDNVRRKLREGFIHRLKSFILLELKVRNINGVQYTKYLMDTYAAKLFVANYENDIGRAYLEYLIIFEKRATEALKEAYKQVQYLKDQVTTSTVQQALLAEHSSLKEKIEKLELENSSIILFDVEYRTIVKAMKKRAQELFNWGSTKCMVELICNRIAQKYNIQYLHELRCVDFKGCCEFVKKFPAEGSIAVGNENDHKIPTKTFLVM